MMPDEAALLFANEVFYRAFAGRDFDAMRDIWAADAATACIHPGWAPLLGTDSVLESWRAILTGPNAPAIECRAPKAFVCGDTGFVLCYEQIGRDTLVATNIFVRRGSIWKLVHHQAGPVAQPMLEETSSPPDLESRH